MSTHTDSFSELTSITFFFPSKVIGGCELLFVRLARFLTEERGLKVHVIDYPDGVLAKSLGDSTVEVINYLPGKKSQVPSGTCLVTSATHIFLLSRMLSLPPDTRLLFWFLHPYSLLTHFPKCNFLMKMAPEALRTILKVLFFQERHAIYSTLHFAHSSSALLFMDSENLRINQLLFDLSLRDPAFLPVPLGEKAAYYTDAKGCGVSRSRDEITLGWLGRLADHKVYTLDFVIREAHNYARNRGQTVCFHVIGDGEFRSYLEDRLPKDDFIGIRMVGTLVGKDLNRYLCENVDLLFAMGTSALEGARLHIPTVLLDACYSEMPKNYKFRWLFETTGFDLGMIVSCESTPLHRHTFADIYEEVRKDKEMLGGLCHDYYSKNHSMTAIADRFIEFAKSSRLTFGNMETGGYHRTGSITQAWLSARNFARRIRSAYRVVAASLLNHS